MMPRRFRVLWAASDDAPQTAQARSGRRDEVLDSGRAPRGPGSGVRGFERASAAGTPRCQRAREEYRRLPLGMRAREPPAAVQRGSC